MTNARRYVGPIDDDKAISTKQYINTTVTTLASTSVTAGDGLTGGGQLTANVTVTMGTPSSITSTSTNSVTSTSHTHAITGFSVDGHTHTIANVDSLQTSLDGKVPTGRTVTAGNGMTGGGELSGNITLTMGTPSSITSSSTNSVTSTSHTHAITGFSLDGHTHTIANVTNLQTTLDGKAASSHTHTIANVTNLQTTLDEKAASSHTHSYLALAGGTMTGVLTAQNNTSYTTKQVRNITLSTADPSGGANGDVWIKYTA